MTDSRSWKTWRFSFLSVAMKLWLRLELSVPLSARNPPLIGCFTLPGLMSLSAWLFVNGTSSSLAKRKTAAGCFFDLSHKFRPFVRFILPFGSVLAGGGSSFSPAAKFFS